jgi:protein-disulfide isomerase
MSRSFLPAFLLAAVAASAQSTQTVQAQIDSLRNEVQAMKQQQSTMLQQLGAIQQMLQRQQAPQPPANPVVDLKGAPVRGSSDAKIAIVEYTDYWCGFCARFATQTMPEIVKRYIETGKVRYYLKDFAAQRGPKVAQAARCAGDQQKYWQMHDKLFANYGKYDEQQLTSYVQEIGADPTLFGRCIASNSHIADVQKGMDSGGQIGIDGTPTFLIGVIDAATPDQMKTVQRVVGAQPLDAFQAAIESVLAQPTAQLK